MFLTLGVAAHVDAGKTTLCEQMLLHAGVLRKSGRVDHGDAFMDGNELERARGITIFCEQATLTCLKKNGESVQVTLMDTPGHVDFSGEMERALSVLDMALLVVSCAEGVQSHTVPLFRRLKEKHIPTILFLNKTDREGADVERTMAQIKRLLSQDCVRVADVDLQELREELAVRDEQLMEQHLEEIAEAKDYLAGAKRALYAGALYPVLTGSALMNQGIEALMQAIAELADTQASVEAPFSAKVYRVSRREGTRYSYIKVLSGNLAVRDAVNTVRGEEKVNAIYSAQGTKLTAISQVQAGQTAVVTGVLGRPGEYIGEEAHCETQTLVPLMSVEVQGKSGLEKTRLLAHLRELEEEDPLLSVRAQDGRIAVGVMGAVQIEVLGDVLASRFGAQVCFMPPKVLYKETIASPVVGIGHYEPLRHYAETWLRLVPGELGSGVCFEAKCAPNTLDTNWQRLIRTHVLEREHLGILTGSPITDIRVELIAGRAHLKHTEGGDFREATYRAIRNALMQAENVLLEPLVRFELAMQEEMLNRVTGELIRMGAQLDVPIYDENEVRLEGVCTAAVFWDYPRQFAATTRGYGRIRSAFCGYVPCKNQEAIVEEMGYRALADEQNPPGSVFCSHGAGYYVPWDEVRAHAHCEVEETC